MDHLGFVKNKPVLTFYEKECQEVGAGGGKPKLSLQGCLAPNLADAFSLSLFLFFCFI